MDTSGPVRRAAAAAIALGLALVGMPAAGVGALDASSRAQVDKPLVKVDHAASRSRFSPNGDHRIDRARIRFRLASPADVTVVVRDIDERVRGRVRLGRLATGAHGWTWDGRERRSEKDAVRRFPDAAAVEL